MTMKAAGQFPPGMQGIVYEGVSDGAGLFAVVFATPYADVPSINPQCQPGVDDTTRVRVTARSVNGFTVRTEKNSPAFLSLLGINILSAGVQIVAAVPVSVIVAPR